MRISTTSMDTILLDNGILIISPPPDFTGPEVLGHAVENVAVFKESYSDKLTGILALLPEHYVKAEANRYYKENAPKVPIAMVGTTFLKRMIGNFFLSMRLGSRPMRLFDTKEEALHWLEMKIDVQKLVNVI